MNGNSPRAARAMIAARSTNMKIAIGFRMTAIEMIATARLMSRRIVSIARPSTNAAKVSQAKVNRVRSTEIAITATSNRANPRTRKKSPAPNEASFTKKYPNPLRWLTLRPNPKNPPMTTQSPPREAVVAVAADAEERRKRRSLKLLR